MANVKLESSDEKVFDVPKEIAEMSITVKELLSDLGGDSDCPIPLPNVDSDVLARVIEYCTYHHEHPSPEMDDHTLAIESKRTDNICNWDKEFCGVDQKQLVDLVLAANFLDIKSLLEVTCKTIANMINGKTPEQIKETFNIDDSQWTPEEEHEIRKEHGWIVPKKREHS